MPAFMQSWQVGFGLSGRFTRSSLIQFGSGFRAIGH